MIARFFRSSFTRRRVAAAVSLVTIAACENSTSATGPDGGGTAGLNEIVTAGPLNASSTDTLIYYSLAQGAQVSSSGDWDLALRRFEIQLNGGLHGAKGVTGYAMGNNTTATDAQVIAFTAANTLAAFDSVRAAQIPDDGLFVADRLVEDNTAYVSFAGAPGANAAAYWKVRTASGGYAVMHITAITYDQTGSLTSITVESRLQTGTTLGAAQQATVPIAGAPVNISLASNGGVTAAGCNWDLLVDPQTFALTTNAACNVGTYPGGSAPTFTSATTASDAPQYGAFLAGIAGSIPNDASFTDKTAPYRYSLQSDQRLYPTFNTYLIKSGANVYKLQAINYYSESGTSGYPTIRFARIR